MSQPATETTAMPTTLTLINPSEADTAQVVAEETTLTALEERQNLLAHHVRLVARGMSVGLFVFAVAGQVWARVARCSGRSPRGHVPGPGNSHITPLALYATLYHNRSLSGSSSSTTWIYLRLNVAPRASAVGSLG